MTKRNEIYRCEICGNIVEVTHEGGGQLVCCGQPMELMEENTVDASREKHIPVIARNGDKMIVRVGSVPHPMEEKHYIEWIELIADGVSYKKFLNPGEKPEAEFCIEINVKEIIAREYCNLHGLWKN